MAKDNKQLAQKYETNVSAKGNLASLSKIVFALKEKETGKKLRK